MIIEVNCTTHGLTEGYISSGARHRPRCKKCNVAAAQKRRKKLKQMAVAYKGDCCNVCGYDKCVEALEFHHVDPTQKDFGIAAKGVTISWERMQAELDKCIMLCANCHAEEHVKLRIVQ